MKKILYILPLVLLMGCTKTTDTEPDKVLVRFNVSSLDVDVQPMTKATDAASSSVTSIDYFITNTATNQVYEGNQTKTDAGDKFGTVELYLAPGTYNWIFFATGDGNGSAKVNIPRNRYEIDDKDSFILNETGKTISADQNNYSLVLPRKVGKLEINLADDLSEFASVEVSTQYYIFWLMDDDKLSTDGSNAPKTSLTIDNTGACPKYEAFILPQSISLTIGLKDKSGVTVASTTMDVTIYQNRKTIISGNLLDVLQGKALTVQVGDTWGDDNAIVLGGE